jgi:DNA-binding NarL/FixJ family response regulator
MSFPPTQRFLAPESQVRILVVDDFIPWLRFVRSLLEISKGLLVFAEAADGLEAVQKAKELQPDLILLDIVLPKLNGIEAARQIRTVAPNSKIIFVSDEAMADVVDEAISLGALGYVVKTRAVGELLRAIEVVLQGGRFFQ